MNISFDFPLILTLLVIITGIISILDILIWVPKRKALGGKEPSWIEYSRSFFPALFIVLIIRSFLVQPYRVPTGSLEPTILPGDFIIVNQYVYGLRLPVTNTKIVKVREPQLGEIALFRWPSNPSIVFVKRVIGTPGDHIVYRNKVLTINGKEATQVDLGSALDVEVGASMPATLKLETLPNGITHQILIKKGINEGADFDVTVPDGQYFMMGDNRDGSDDSRSWGYVPEGNLIGKAFGIWMSWDSDASNIRWERIGKVVR